MMEKNIAKIALMTTIAIALMTAMVAGAPNVAASAPALDIARVKSTDAAGVEKDVFMVGEDVYCIIKTVHAGTLTVDVYVVYNDEWHGGGVMTDRGDGYDTITLTSAGPNEVHGPFLIWSAPLKVGDYDIVVDQNQNGVRDPGEKVDSSCVDPGFLVIPELPLGTLMAMVASFGAMAGLAVRRLPKTYN